MRGNNMQYIKEITDYQGTSQAVMTIGKFDGLHKGHQKLIREVQRIAKTEHMCSVVFAFDMHHQEQIVTNKERCYLLDEQVDYFVECQFTEALHNMSAKDFIEKVLIDVFHVKHLIVGDDFRFGNGRRGTPELLKTYEKRGVFQVTVFSKEKYDKRDISSTYIKEVIHTGDMELVHRLLGYPYTILETVVQGKQIGRTIGIPTLNLRLEKEKILPTYGVYFCKVYIGNTWYEGICNIGVRPSVEDDHCVNAEVHLFDYAKEVYGEQVVVQVLKRERKEKKFADLKALQIQVKKDIEEGKRYFTLIENLKREGNDEKEINRSIIVNGFDS